MYFKNKTIPISKSLSAFPKILSISKTKDPKIFWLHRNSFNSIGIGGTEDNSKATEVHKEVTLENDFLTRLKWFDLKSTSFIVVLSHTGVKFYKENNDLIYEYAFDSNIDDKSQLLYGTGIASLESSVVCVSTNDGSVLTFNVNPNNKISFSKLLKPSKENERSITDLASDQKSKLAASYDCGDIVIWNYRCEDQQLDEKVILAAHERVSCNCLLFFNDYLWAGYGSGHIRLFDTCKKVLLCEISAHSKWITGLDVAPQMGLVLSTSEDSFVRVWQLSEENDSIEVNHKFSESVANNMLFGGVFLDESGDSFCVGGYDSLDLHRFSFESVKP